jgi:hypothetical protein
VAPNSNTPAKIDSPDRSIVIPLFFLQTLLF